MSTWLRARVVPLADQRSDKRRRAGFDRQGDLMALDALGGDALAHAASLDMGQAWRVPMGLVEMDVAVDERRQEQQPVEIDAFRWPAALSPAHGSRR